MARLTCLLLLLPLLSEVSCTFSLFLPAKSSQYPPQYIQQQDYAPQQQQYVECPSCANQVLPDLPEQQNQVQQSSDYWPEGSSPSQEYQDESQDPGYRFQAYQSSYRHHVQQSINPYSSHPSPVYQQIPQHIPTYHHSPQPISTYHPTPQPISTYHQVAQVPDHGVLSGQGVLPPSRLSPPTSLPVYQLVTMGPELPVLVRLPNQQTAILPVRTVYSLPNFLERIVQRVQNYYSVYTPLEVLKVPRQNETAPEEASTTSEAPASTSTTAKPDLADRISTGSTEASPTTTEESQTTTAKEAEGGEATTVTDSNDVQQETTTTQ